MTAVTVEVPIDLLRLLVRRASECCDEIEAIVAATYPSRGEQPVQQRRYDRDMALPLDTRDVLAHVRAAVPALNK